MMIRTERNSEGADKESGRVSLGSIRVSGTTLEQTLERMVKQSTSDKVPAAMFSSSI